MIEKFIDSVLIIDDNEEEVEGLKKVLEEKDIWVTYLEPPIEKQQIEKIKPYRNRQLIFLDLRIDETKKTIENISTIIRPLLLKVISYDFGSYGIVMWTKHETHISEFKRKIQNDKELYQMPLFVVQMDKSNYLKYGFDNILTDLNTALKHSPPANFFINWSNLVQKGREKAITSIFKLVPDYEKQDKNLEFLLFKMAQNYTGIPFGQIDPDYPLSVDAIKAFNELLVYEINSISESTSFNISKDGNVYILNENDLGWSVENELTTSKNDLVIKKINKETLEVGNSLTKKEKKNLLDSSNEEIVTLFAKVNTKLLIDETNIQQDKIIPGNVYEIKDTESKLKHPELPDGATPIVIEMTPPCDFSNNKTVYPRVLSGYVEELVINKIPERDKFYKELWPIKLKDKEKAQIIVFDFSILGFVEEQNLKDDNKYKLLFRVKDKLFADILQKMSAYTARLGLSIIR